MSEFESLGEARENLKMREGTSDKYIHSITSDGQAQGDGEQTVASTIQSWLGNHKEVQAAIWTGLPSNWTEKRNKQFTTEDAIAYLRELEDRKDQATSTYTRAREYVTNTPAQIQTPVRKAIQQRSEWSDAKLSINLFE